MSDTQTEKPKEKQITTVTYMPMHHDADETVVDGITFKAYETIDIGEGKADLAEKLQGNPWFTTGEVDADRKALWEKVRKAEKGAAENTATAARLKKDAVGEIAKQEAAAKQKTGVAEAKSAAAEAEDNAGKADRLKRAETTRAETATKEKTL